MLEKMNRSNAEWVAALRGELGTEAQYLAHKELACYLFIVIRNHLSNRATTIPRLARLHSDEIDNLAQDFLQSFLLKMTQSDYAMLKKFNGTGRFLAWAAQVANNLVASEFRRVEWLNQSMAEDDRYIDTNSAPPEKEAMSGDLKEVVTQCLSCLPEHYQQALQRCIVDGDCAKEVAEDMEITQNAVHILVYRAKKAMLTQLASHDVGPDSLAVFA